MNYIISALVMTMIIPAWGLIMHLVKKILYSIIRSITNSRVAMFVTNWVTFPGVIHHESAHALVALISGARITEFKPFWPDRNSGTLGQVSFVTRGPLLIRSLQLSLTSVAPVVMGSVTSFILINMITRGTLNLSFLILFCYLAFSILIHSSMSVADVKVMVKGIWALFLIALLGCIVFGIDFSNCIFINEI